MRRAITPLALRCCSPKIGSPEAPMEIRRRRPPRKRLPLLAAPLMREPPLSAQRRREQATRAGEAVCALLRPVCLLRALRRCPRARPLLSGGSAASHAFGKVLACGSRASEI